VQQVKRVAVVGCGTMGAGVTHVAAQHGYEVTVVEVSDQAAAAGRRRVVESLQRTVARGKLSQADAELAGERVTVGSDLAVLADADLVIEAVFEDVTLKCELLARIDRIAPPEVMIASNTSTIPLVILGGATQRPEAIVGCHFFNPVPAMKLIEVIKTPITLQENVDGFVAFAESLGKSPVVVNDVPGFVGNLLIVPYLLDAIRAFERGVADLESMDAVIKLGFNHPMGPFALADLIGLDIVHDMAASMYEEYKEARYFPPPLLKQYVRLGWLGRKSGRGFYSYAS
jgi:3-hydroxybutyryl-CoA dehydrogenase